MNKMIRLVAVSSIAAVLSDAAFAESESAPTAVILNSTKKTKKPPMKARMLVAIDKFDNKAGVEANQFGTIRTRIQQAVVGTRKFEVVEREQMKNVLSEHNLIAAGMTNGQGDDAPQAGKLKAAGFVVYGNVLFYGTDQSQVKLSGVAGSSVRIKLELQIKITDAETGRILAQKSVVGVGQESRLATGESSTSGNLIEQCERAAVAEAAHRVVDALRDVCYPAKIMNIGRKEVCVNMTNEEVSTGDKFDVVEESEELTDPDTGASLGRVGEVVGRVEISRTDSKVSYARAVEYWDLDDHETCEFSLKELKKDSTYIVRRVSADRLEAEKNDQRNIRKAEQSSPF